MIPLDNELSGTPSATQSAFYIAKPLLEMNYLWDIPLCTGKDKFPASNGAVLDPEKEKILRDVLYTVDCLMGRTRSWTVASSSSNMTHNEKPGTCLASDGLSSSTVVSAEKISSLLEKAFNTDQETIQRLREETYKRKLPHFWLDLTIVEADIQSQKESEETTNSHIRVQTIPKNSKTSKTPQIKDSIRPKWKHNVRLMLSSVYSDRVLLELWQEREEVRVKKRHQIRGRHQDLTKNLLLAEFQLHLKDTLDRGINGWYEMENRLATNLNERSRVRLSGHISCEGEVEWNVREAYDSLVRILCDPQGERKSQKEQDGPCGSSTEDSLSPVARTVLCQHALMLNLRQSSQLLSLWCNVTFASSPVDWHLVVTQFKQITASLVLKMFTAEEEQCLRKTLSEVICRCIRCLTNLEVCFPLAFPDRSRLQLTSLLQTVRSMEDHPSIRPLVRDERRFGFKAVIKTALQGFSLNWRNDIDHDLSKCANQQDQLDATLMISCELVHLIKRFAEFYDPIFTKEFDICSLKVVYQTIVKDVMNYIKPVIINCCQSIPKSVESIGENGIEYDFLRGSHLMKIYKNLIKLCGQWCSHLSAANLKSAGVEEYHTFFEAAVENQLALTTDRESRLIRDVILKDNLQPIDPQTPYSASLKEATAIPHRMKIWWFDLVWPDAEDRVVHLIRVLKSLISLNISYCQNLVAELDSVVQDVEGGNSQLFINNKVCVVIVNMEKQLTELKKYPDILGYKSLESQTNGRHTKELQSIVDNAVLTIQQMIKLFILTVMEKKEKCLERSMVAECQNCGRSTFLGKTLTVAKGQKYFHSFWNKILMFIISIVNKHSAKYNFLDKSIVAPHQDFRQSTFLVEAVYPALDLLRKSLTVATCQQFLQCFWNNVLKVMRGIVNKDPARNPNFYGKMLQMLRNIFDDLTPDSEEALDTHSAETEEYESLLEDLKLMAQSSASLINSYHQERQQQQQQQQQQQKDDSISPLASLTIRTWFREGKRTQHRLVVYVVMAKDIVVPPKNAHKAPLKYYVSVRLLLLQPSSPTSKEQDQHQVKEMTTQVIMDDPATFDAELEFDLDNAREEDFQNGLIQLTLKDRNRTRPDTFLGESYVLLRDAARGRAGAQNLHLKMVAGNTMNQRCQRILQILGKRDSDRQANAFIKNLKKRHNSADFSDLLKSF